MIIPLDKRLSACASLVSGCGIAVDVGTDHGYLPCRLVTDGTVKKAVAADINEAPLESAKAHIAEYGLSDRIQTVLSDGLDSVQSDSVSDVIIAGMGGELIADIVSRAERFYGSRFILQPMTRAEVLRSRLWDSGFEIISETACREEFYYTVMLAVYRGAEYRRSYDRLHTYVGMMGNSTADEKGYILRQAQRLRTKGDGMLRGSGPDSEAERLLDMARALEIYAAGGKEVSLIDNSRGYI